MVEQSKPPERRFWTTYVRVTLLSLLVGVVAGALVIGVGYFLAALPYGASPPDVVVWGFVPTVGAIVGLFVGGMQWWGLPGIYTPVRLRWWGWTWISVMVHVAVWAAVVFGLIAFSTSDTNFFVVAGVAIGGVVVVAAVPGILLRWMLHLSGSEQRRTEQGFLSRWIMVTLLALVIGLGAVFLMGIGAVVLALGPATGNQSAGDAFFRGSAVVIATVFGAIVLTMQKSRLREASELRGRLLAVWYLISLTAYAVAGAVIGTLADDFDAFFGLVDFAAMFVGILLAAVIISGLALIWLRPIERR